MPQRIRLTFDRNQDPQTKLYRVYRSMTSPVTRKATHVMTIDQPVVPTPIAALGELLVRIGPGRYKGQHANWLDTSPPRITVDGVEPAGAYTIDYAAGEVHFSENLETRLPVMGDYHFDGVRVLDHNGPQPGVTFHGPIAVDQADPQAPDNIQIRLEQAYDRVVLTWNSPQSGGTTFYYRVEAEDHEGRKSRFSVERQGRVLENLDSAPYQVERSFDMGASWAKMTRTHKPGYVEALSEFLHPNPISHLVVTGTLAPGTGTGHIVMNWAPPALTSAKTPQYRLRSVSVNQLISPPSAVVGPIEFSAAPEAIIVRRKVYDGSYPTFDGPDAETIATLSSTATGFEDNPAEQTTWVYAIYVTSEGAHSAGALVKVELGDGSAPDPVVIISISETPL